MQIRSSDPLLIGLYVGNTSLYATVIPHCIVQLVISTMLCCCFCSCPLLLLLSSAAARYPLTLAPSQLSIL